MAAHLRDETEGAGTVAAFRNLYERVVSGRCKNARRRFIVKICRALIAYGKDWKRASVYALIANFRYLVYLIRAYEGVNFRQLRAQLFTIALDQTACDYQTLRTPFRFQTRCFKNSLYRLLLCRFDKTARVHNERIRLACVRSNLITGLAKLAHHHFAINQVFRTTETYKTNLFHEC